MNYIDLIALADAYCCPTARRCLPIGYYAPGEALAVEAAREVAAIDWFHSVVTVHAPLSFDDFLNGVVADVIDAPPASWCDNGSYYDAGDERIRD